MVDKVEALRAPDLSVACADDAGLPALEIGLSDDYQRDPKAKEDLIDLVGDAHSAKSGQGSGRYFCIGAVDSKLMTSFRY